MPGAVVGNGAVIEKSVIGPNAIIGAEAKIGVNHESEDNPYNSKYCTHGIVLIEGGAEVADGADILKGSMVQIEE